MASISSQYSTEQTHVRPISDSDFDEWNRLFRAYIDFYESSLPDEQYHKTFSRLLNPASGLRGFLLHDDSNIIGFAHFFPIQTPWDERSIMHLNDLFVDPQCRGHGHGRRLIQAVAVQARKEGCLRLQWATKHNNPARKLYDELATCDFVEYRMKFE